MSKEQYIALPEEYTRRELNARYREIPLKDTTSRLLRKYFNAMANLYGIIPLHKAKEIVFSLSPKLVTEDEFLAFAEIARHECEGYYILGGDELYTYVRHTKPLDREIIRRSDFFAFRSSMRFINTASWRLTLTSFLPEKRRRNLPMPSGEKGAFHRFKQSVRYHGLEQRWYDYLAEAYRELAIRWCAEEGLEYTE